MAHYVKVGRETHFHKPTSNICDAKDGNHNLGLAPAQPQHNTNGAGKSFNPFEDADVSQRAMAAAPTHKASQA